MARSASPLMDAAIKYRGADTMKRALRKLFKAFNPETMNVNDLLEDVLELHEDELEKVKPKDEGEVPPADPEPEKGKDAEKEEEADEMTEIEKLKAEHAKELAKVKLESKIDAALSSAKSKNDIAVKALLKLEQIQLNDKGEIEGLTEQLETVVKDNPFLFGETQTKQTGYNPNAGKNPTYTADLGKAMKEKGFNLTEFAKNLAEGGSE